MNHWISSTTISMSRAQLWVCLRKDKHESGDRRMQHSTINLTLFQNGSKWCDGFSCLVPSFAEGFHHILAHQYTTINTRIALGQALDLLCYKQNWFIISFQSWGQKVPKVCLQWRYFFGGLSSFAWWTDHEKGGINHSHMMLIKILRVTVQDKVQTMMSDFVIPFAI